MVMKIDYHRTFRKDLRRLRKSGWDMHLFDTFVEDLRILWPLPAKYEVHPLHGVHSGIWDIHIRQNWLVLLKKEGDAITLLRTGTHAMLGIG
jgi:mRNA interferase YafQ